MIHKRIKEPIRLRQKALANGGFSLYLDTWHNGRRKYEFLRLFLNPAKTKADREENARVLQLANAIKAKRLVELQNGEYGFQTEKGKHLLLPFLDAVNAERPHQLKWGHLRRLLQQHCDLERLRFSDITREWSQNFLDFLKSYKKSDGGTLARNTIHLYYTTYRTLLRLAIRRGYIERDPSQDVEGLRKADTVRRYLTLEEVRAVAALRMKSQKAEHTRIAFLFSCLTGLRWSDIVKLQWSEVNTDDRGTRLVFAQQKTGGLEYIDLSRQAAELLPPRGAETALVFADFARYLPMACNRHVAKIIRTAGIDKHITFHCARHTFATMLHDLDVDLYTISKLLGHRDISTTQVYAKVVDKKKRDAVNSVPDIF